MSATHDIAKVRNAWGELQEVLRYVGDEDA